MARHGATWAWQRHGSGMLRIHGAQLGCSGACLQVACPCCSVLPSWPQLPPKSPMQATLVYCRRLGVTARLRALLWMAAALYTFGLYSEVGFQSCILLLMLAWRMDLHTWHGLASQNPSERHRFNHLHPQLSSSSKAALSSLLLLPALQAQFYAHGMGLNPSERRTRLGMAVIMEAAVLLALVAEYRK